VYPVLRVSLLTALLAACTAAPAEPDPAAGPGLDPTVTVAARATETAASPATATLVPATPTSAPLEATATQPALTATPPPIDDAFRPSDPNGVVLAAGRPQLVEFYAVW
jgi:hypothetical protein